ncbi:hypothetical protein Tco_0421651 [Tanacetum coccineum]
MNSEIYGTKILKNDTSFYKGKLLLHSDHGPRGKASSSWKSSEGGNKPNFKKGFKNKQRPDHKPDRFSLLTKTPKEIFALEKGKFKTPTSKVNGPLRKQIDEMIKAGKLSQFIKELKQNDKTKAPKKGKAFGKDKPLTILMIQPWERVNQASPRITQALSGDGNVFSTSEGRRRDGGPNDHRSRNGRTFYA